MRSSSHPKWGSFAFLIASYLLASTSSAHPQAQDSFQDRLGEHAILGGLALDEIAPERGLLVHVEVQPGADPERAVTIASEMAEIFTTSEKRLSERLGGLPEPSEVHVVVVQSSKTWADSHAADGTPTPNGAYFDPNLGPDGAVVTYDLAWPGSPKRVRLAGLREALGQALVASHATTPATGLPGALLAGLARLAAQDEGDGGTILTVHAPEPTVHDRLVAQLAEGGFEDGFLTDSAELVAPLGLDGLWASARAATTEAREPELWAARRYESLVDEAAWLFAVGLAEPSSREPLLGWITARLGPDGAGDPADLGPAESAAWAKLLAAEHVADLAFDPRGLGGPELFAAAVRDLALPDHDPKDAVVAGRAEDLLAESLWLASKGRLEEARARLAGAGDEAVIVRHRSGLEALAVLRANYLAHLADGAVSEKLRIDYGGKLLAADVTRVGRKSVFLGDNSQDLDSLPITAIDIGELVGRMEKEKPPFGDPMARAWAQALVKGTWKRSLDIEQKKDKALMADLEGVEGQLERGRVLNLLGVVDDAAGSNPSARLAAIADLLASARDTAEVKNAGGHLEEVARGLLETRFKDADLAALLSAASIERKGDVWTVEYDFKDKAQLADWPEVANYAPDFVGQFPKLETTTVTRVVEDHMLLVHGASIFQHLLAFEGPQKLTYEMSYERTKSKKDATVAQLDYVYASICDDLNYQHLRTSQFGNLDVVDTASKTNVQKTRETPLSYKLGSDYRMEIELDAKGKFTTRFDGQEVFSLDGHERTAGRVLFMIHSDRVVRLSKVTLEGRLAENQAPLQAMWVAGQLSELGF